MTDEIKDTPGGGTGDEPTGGDGGDKPQEPQGGAPATPTEFEIAGQKYTSTQLEEALKLVGDYRELVPEFTRKSQRLAEYEKLGKLEDLKTELEKLSKAPSTPEVEEARRILKEQLGVVTKEDIAELTKALGEIQKQIQDNASKGEDAQLEDVVKTLSEKYSGKKGEPAFKIEELAKAVKENPSLAVYVQVNGQYLIDLEQTYRRVHVDFWDKIPEMKARIPRTERGSGPQTATPATDKEAETEEERIEDAVSFFKKSSPQGE